MLSKRVIALSSDKALSRRLAAGLMAAGGSTEVRESLDELPRGEIQADLVVVHISNEGERAWLDEVNRRAAKHAAMIAVVQASSLDEIVKAMRGNRVSAVLVADALDASRVSAVATRLLYGDVFGLEKVVPWGVRVYSHLVGDYQEKSVAISAVSDYAGSIGVRRKYREPIEQCLDEMLMNALYDAPVDTEGKQLFADVPTKTRISLRMEQKAVVQYACDGNTFSLSVRDSFGALKPETVTEYLYKCLYSSQQIDRKAGGAGLGLYIIANASTQFFVNIYPGLATEVVVTFDLTAAKVQLKEFGLFQEKIDSAGRLVAGPSRLVATGQIPIVSQPPAGSKGVVAALSAACVLLLALIAIVAYPRFIETPVGAVTITTVPPGADVELEGKAVGTTEAGPVTVKELQAGRAYRVVAHLDGHDTAEQIVVPQRDANAAVTLALTPQKPVIVFETDPPGALVRMGDRDLGTTPFTTTELAAENGSAEVTFSKPGYQPMTRTVRLPEPGKQGTIFTALAVAGDFGTVDLASNPPGARVTHNGTLLPGVTPLPDLLLEGGKAHTFTFALDGYRTVTKQVTVEAGKKGTPLDIKLEPGGAVVVDVNIPGARVTVAGAPGCKAMEPPATCGLANGEYQVSVGSQTPFLKDRFEVKVDGNEVKRDLRYGIVEAPKDFTFKAPGAPKGTTRMALPEGTHTVTLLNAAGEATSKQVKVTAGGKPTVLEP